jgi:hypothetical protein
MTPWFPEHYAWVFGTAIGVCGGIFGALVGVLGPQGKAKGLVLGFYWTVLAVSLVMLVAGIGALLTGQPYGIWYGLGLAGLIGTLVLGLNYPTIRNVYLRAEERKLLARDL